MTYDELKQSVLEETLRGAASDCHVTLEPDQVRYILKKVLDRLEHAQSVLSVEQTTGEELSGLRDEILEALKAEYCTDLPDNEYDEAYNQGIGDAINTVTTTFNRYPSAKPGTDEVTNQEFSDAISQVPLSISSTRRGAENGLRNADEVYQALKQAGYRLVKRGAA